MELDDELCLCFHVTQRKIVNYLRRDRPVRASQLSGCGGAGTGCGWCRPYLEQLFTAFRANDASRPAEAGRVALPAEIEQISADAYHLGRQAHLADQRKASPPEADDPTE